MNDLQFRDSRRNVLIALDFGACIASKPARAYRDGDADMTYSRDETPNGISVMASPGETGIIGSECPHRER